MHANFLAEVASHGCLVLALGLYVEESNSDRGGMMGMGGTKSDRMLEAIDWATAENKRPGSKFYGKLDPSKFAVAGMSCGGLQALEVAPDPRVKTVMAMNSGLFGPVGRYGCRSMAEMAVGRRQRKRKDVHRFGLRSMHP